MANVENPGVYRAEIVESGLSFTQKGFPQWSANLKLTECWVEDPALLKHFVEHKVLSEEVPSWVPWTDYNESITAYLVLFRDAEAFTEETALLNYEQLVKATGWEGTSFDGLTGDSLIGTVIQVRIEENTYNERTSLRVNWIDGKDTNPQRSLRTANLDEVKAANSKLQISKAAAPKTPAKAPAKAPPAPAPKATPVAEAPEAKRPGRGRPPKKTAEAAPAAPPKAEAPKVESAEDHVSSIETAWDWVQGLKGSASEKLVEETWIKVLETVQGDRDEADLTKEDWVNVASATVDAIIADNDIPF